MKPKNPITSIIGILVGLLPIIALLFPHLFGIDWGAEGFVEKISAALLGLGNEITAAFLIFKAGDKGGW